MRPVHGCPSPWSASLRSASRRPGCGCAERPALFAIMLCMSVAINACIAATEIYAAQTLAFPLRDAVLGPFLSGNLRTLASEYLGWSPGAGFICGKVWRCLSSAGWPTAQQNSRQIG